MERRTRTGAGLGAAALLGALLLGGCQPRNEYSPPPPPEVTVARPTVRTIIDYAQYTGNTQPSEQVVLRSRVQGYLESIRFIDGTFVDKGELLFVIDQRPYKAALDQANSQVLVQDARLKLATADFNSMDPLLTRLAVLCGTTLLGWEGALIAVPFAAMLQVIFEEVIVPWRQAQW